MFPVFNFTVWQQIYVKYIFFSHVRHNVEFRKNQLRFILLTIFLLNLILLLLMKMTTKRCSFNCETLEQRIVVPIKVLIFFTRHLRTIAINVQLKIWQNIWITTLKTKIKHSTKNKINYDHRAIKIRVFFNSEIDLIYTNISRRNFNVPRGV